MDLAVLIKKLEKAQELATEGESSWTRLHDSERVMLTTAGPGGELIVSSNTSEEDATAISIRHNTAGEVLDQLRQFAAGKGDAG